MLSGYKVLNKIQPKYMQTQAPYNKWDSNKLVFTQKIINILVKNDESDTDDTYNKTGPKGNKIGGKDDKIGGKGDKMDGKDDKNSNCGSSIVMYI